MQWTGWCQRFLLHWRTPQLSDLWNMRRGLRQWACAIRFIVDHGETDYTGKHRKDTEMQTLAENDPCTHMQGPSLIYTAKTLQPHFSVAPVWPRKATQHVFLKVHWVASSLATLASLSFQKQFGYIPSWHFYHNHATKELLQRQMCKIKETTNPT